MIRREYIFCLITCLFIISTVHATNNIALDAYGYFWSEQYNASIEAFTEAINQTEDINADYHLKRGLAYYHLQQYPEVIYDFEKAKSYNNYTSALWLARAYSITGERVKAITNLEYYLTHCPSPDTDQIKKDTLFKTFHTTDRWLQLWQGNLFTDEQKTAEDVNWNLSKGNVAEAHRIVERSIEGGLNAQTMHALNAKVYAYDENWQMALYEINKVLNAGGSTIYQKMKVEYLVKNNQIREATQVLSALLETDPYDFDSRYNYAQLTFEIGQYVTARNQLDICLKYKQTPELLLLSGNIYRATGSYLDALRCFNPLLEQDSANAAVLSARGITYYHTKIYKSAAYDMSMSLDLLPNDAETNYYMGLTQKALGKTDDACFYFKRAQRYGEVKAYNKVVELCKP